MQLHSDSFMDGSAIAEDFAFAKIATVDHVALSRNRNPHLALLTTTLSPPRRFSVVETATQTLHRLTSLETFDEDTIWDPPVADPRVNTDFTPNDLDHRTWYFKRYDEDLPVVHKSGWTGAPGQAGRHGRRGRHRPPGPGPRRTSHPAR